MSLNLNFIPHSKAEARSSRTRPPPEPVTTPVPVPVPVSRPSASVDIGALIDLMSMQNKRLLQEQNAQSTKLVEAVSSLASQINSLQANTDQKLQQHTEKLREIEDQSQFFRHVEEGSRDEDSSVEFVNAIQ